MENAEHPTKRSRHWQDYLRLSRLLSREREGAKLTQVGLAARLGRPQSFVSKYEGGQRTLTLIEFIEVADGIGADPVALLRELLEGDETRPLDEPHTKTGGP